MRFAPVSVWKAEPFSFHKIWLVASVWFGLGTGIVWLMTDVEYPLSNYVGDFIGLLVWGAINFFFQHAVKPIVWHATSDQFRQNIAYDRREAATGKGSIHSYGDLWRWLTRRRDSDHVPRS